MPFRLADICLVACSAGKAPSKMPAKGLYTSALFRKSQAFANQYCGRWFILSAKHHLVTPDERISPYDETLNDAAAKQRVAWANETFSQLCARCPPSASIMLLAGERYRRGLVPLLRHRGHEVMEPLKGLSIGRQLQWLSRACQSSDRLRDTSRAYNLLKRLTTSQGMPRLGDISSRGLSAERGVYFFFDDNESRIVDARTLRLVRIGTHGVSRGSGSTLWQRLRTHRGGKDLGGNHRGSVFRLHVGAALQRRAGYSMLRSWGRGRSAPLIVRQSEAALERRVSEYLAVLRVAWIGVPDVPGPTSDRSFVERNLIALVSNQLAPTDLPSSLWLGRQSPTREIRESGLWNVNHVLEEYDARFLDVLEAYVESTLGISPAPATSVAPADWLAQRLRREPTGSGQKANRASRQDR